LKVTVLGKSPSWQDAGGACSGYLVEHDGFRLLIDPGYATLPRLLTVADAAEVDAVLVSHGHPDHCADLNPLLRARAFRDDPAPALPTSRAFFSRSTALSLSGTTPPRSTRVATR